MMDEFRDREQCEWLNLPLDYYVKPTGLNG